MTIQKSTPRFITPPLHSGKSYGPPVVPFFPSFWDSSPSDAVPAPDEEECRALWDRYGMFEHIRRHSLQVASVAAALAFRAVEIGAVPGTFSDAVSCQTIPDPDIVKVSVAAGLLHDIAKSYTVQYGGSHAQIGAAWVVASTGHYRIAQAVYHHVEWPWPLPENLLHPVFFVMYGDKRARHDELVSVDERFEDLLQRYGKTEQSRHSIHRGWEQAKTIERALSAQLEFPLDESTVVGRRLVKRA